LIRIQEQDCERGFVLATALVMLSLLTLLAVAMYYNSKSAMQISSTAQHSTEGHYYAETAVNYMIWAQENDAEFDNFDAIVAKSGGFNDPNSSVGDREELAADVGNPGPTIISDTTGPGTSGQIMYFDNTPLTNNSATNRAICTGYFNPTGTTDGHYFSTCVNLQETPGNRYAPSLYQISTRLPRYIVLEIDSSGVITPSIPVLPHPTPPVVPPLANPSVPKNGAIVWLTTGNSRMDFEVDPSLGACNAGTQPVDVMGCDANPPAVNPDGWLRAVGSLSTKEDQYGVVVYAIGYVNGRPSSIIRAQIR